MSDLIQVDRYVIPDPTETLKKYGCLGYTEWEYPNLQNSGPTEYKCGDLEKEFPHQGTSFLTEWSGYDFWEYIQKSGKVAGYLSLQDGEAFVKAGVSVFRKFFGKGYNNTVWCTNAESRIILWKSMRFIPSKDGLFRLGIAIPCLRTNSKKVVIEWKHINTNDLNWGKCPLVRFSEARP